MSGLAVVVDWDRPVGPDIVESMLDMVPYRAEAGSRIMVADGAALGESRMVAAPAWQIATDGDLTIVGDLRLWNTDSLRSMGGGASTTQGMDDRHLILAAYRQSGIELLNAVDGDFAFVIWDSAERTAIAARDRFSVKPLFYQQTPTGIRFASEPKQLVAVSQRGPAPDPLSVAEYLDGTLVETRFDILRRNPSRPTRSCPHRFTNGADREPLLGPLECCRLTPRPRRHLGTVSGGPRRFSPTTRRRVRRVPLATSAAGWTLRQSPPRRRSSHSEETSRRRSRQRRLCTPDTPTTKPPGSATSQRARHSLTVISSRGSRPSIDSTRTCGRVDSRGSTAIGTCGFARSKSPARPMPISYSPAMAATTFSTKPSSSPATSRHGW